jgi:hypothetical protein
MRQIIDIDHAKHDLIIKLCEQLHKTVHKRAVIQVQHAENHSRTQCNKL